MKFEMGLHVSEMQKLADIIQGLNKLGHTPATSGNYSIRSDKFPEIALVSESGIDKSKFMASHFLPVNIETGKIYDDFIASGRKSSHETDIHLAIYQSTGAKCIFHSHLLESTLFADLFRDQDSAIMSGLELLKAFKGIKTHDIEVSIPCFDNIQDIPTLSDSIKKALIGKEYVYGVLIRGHGLYCWGGSIDETARHLETFTYIFNYYLKTTKPNKLENLR